MSQDYYHGGRYEGVRNLDGLLGRVIPRPHKIK